tara:strand:+ start:164 stop:547 length:384 start_codon:yes stop_codon:yes gene_type:complete
MITDKIQQIIDYAYPKIQSYYGKGSLDFPKIELHKDIYARLSGDEEQSGEHSRSTKAQYDEDTNVIYIYYPNMKTEEDILRSIIHEYTHYRQDHKLFKQYRQLYSYDENPIEIEAHKNEEDWQLFTN